jgi:hypothetical protein
MMDDPKTACTICGKMTRAECSHVDCPNRRRITAQQIGTDVLTRADHSPTLGHAVIRKPRYFDD